MTDSLVGLDASTFLGLSGAGHQALAGVDAGYLDCLTADELSELQALLLDLESTRQLFLDHRDGCACGPHDMLGVTSGLASADMWTRTKLRATVEADEALVERVSDLVDLTIEDEVYRIGVQLVFGNRARIGRLLRRLPV
ncbi:MAG TPA: hypothetical protein VH352_10710 [Pseudonocardiaceae bacterium]|jgi:hypothetical protein|nr:hypothetical protein [Pseudonocardiaceae bacterium]